MPRPGRYSSERTAGLASVTGHVAESVEILLDEWGYAMLWHFDTVGQHGIHLLALDPTGERVVAFEVKGTLRSGSACAYRRGHVTQMSAAWIDKKDNPGMANWDLQSADLYGAVVAVNFVDLAYRVALTNDFERLHPITRSDKSTDLDGYSLLAASHRLGASL